MSNDAIPIIAEHRGVGLHNHQTAERLTIVRRAIDDVFEMTDDRNDLLKVARDPMWPPESRLLAAAMLEAKKAMAADKRETRPDIDLDYVRACVAGLNSVTWRDRIRYCSMLDVCYRQPGREFSVLRETPLREN
jgi:hypothetical protein